MKGIAGHTQRRSVQEDKLLDRAARLATNAARDKYQEILDAKDARITELEDEIGRLKGGGR